MRLIRKTGAAVLAIAFAHACAGTPPPALEATAPAGAADYGALVDTPDRPDADILADANRKTAAVLALFAPQPGDPVLEIEAGAGYYTELLSRAVGPAGKVYMQNPAGFDAFLGDAVSKRLDGRLTNVTYLKSNFDAFAVPDASLDIATWFQGPHEIWYTPEGVTAPLGNPDTAFRDIARALKSGGQFVVIDHVAPAGSPATTGGDTHRIDPAHIVAMAEAAGLTLETSSDLLRNPDDDGLTNVFDPAIRGKTDQAILIFRKP
ncbi:MAG: class I SAM-dependent methyltransferase [Hyphomonas sp.]|uniref:class I SAM-dependent methyltransferase n=1 Tax=Hyphomonas sp. TaxID=87 RepID=UPI0034A059C6